MPFRFDRSWHFGLSPQELWATLSRTEQYRSWWPWLREFDAQDDGDALRTGAVARVVIQAPLPYQLRCTIRVVDAEPDRRLVTVVDGDLSGPARLELQAPLLRSFARVARPAMAWAHDRVVERGLVQFEGHALRERDRLA